MTQSDKDLLLKDLCARLSHGVKGLVTFNGQPSTPKIQEDRTIDGKLYDRFAKFQDSWYDNVTIKPYLFPLDKIRGDMWSEYLATCVGGNASFPTLKSFEWCNEHHIDYRGLIPMDLANDVTGLNIY